MKNNLFCILFIFSLGYGFAQNNIVYDNLPVYKNTVKVLISHEPTFQNNSQKVTATLENLTGQRIRFRGIYFADLECGEQVMQHFGNGDGIIIKPFQKLDISSGEDKNNLSFDVQYKLSATCLKELAKTPNAIAITNAGYKIVFMEDMDEREAAEKLVAQLDCPTPTSEKFEAVCVSGFGKEPIQGNKLSFSFQEYLWSMSCADPEKDSQAIAKAKIQKMWNANREKFKCSGYDGVYASGLNITSFSMDAGFSTFMIDAVKKFDLDLNFKDPLSKNTIMDFIIDEIDRYSKMQHDNSAKIREYTNIYNLLKIFEVKHASEL